VGAAGVGRARPLARIFGVRSKAGNERFPASWRRFCHHPGVVESGLDLHEWQTRWEELQEQIAEDPEQALPEVVRFVEEMLTERGFELNEPVTEEGEDPDILRDFLAAREFAVAAEKGAAEREDIDGALDDLRDIYEYLVEDRGPP